MEDGTYAAEAELPEETAGAEAAEGMEEEQDGNGWWEGAEAGTAEEGAVAEGVTEDAQEMDTADAEEAAPVIDPDDPAAPVQMEVGWETAAWLQEEDGRRLRKLERLAGGDAEVNENGTLKLMPHSHLAPPGAGGTGHSFCDLCARALSALKSGEEIELTPAVLEIIETSSDGDGLGLTIIEVPGTVEKKAVAGKDGAKLLELCDSSDVIAVFTKEPEAAEAGENKTFESFKTGDVVEGKYGDSWFEVEVLESSESGVKVKWAFDGSESDLTPNDLRQKNAENAETAEAAIEVKTGDQVEAQYGNSWFDAEVLSSEDGKVKVKWGHDGSEEELESSKVRLKAAGASGETAEAAEAAEAEPVELPELKEGVKLEAKYGDSFHDAEADCNLPGSKQENSTYSRMYH